MRISSSGNQSRPIFILLATMCSATLLISAACKSPQNVTYFRDVADTISRKSVNLTEYKTPVIQVDDILQVSIQTMDPTTTALLNQQSATQLPVTGPNTSGQVSPAATAGYLVDKDGYIILPLVGKVEVKGKSTAAIRDTIQRKAAEYYKDPVVNVRFANFKITVLGEVLKPSTYVMPNEKVTVLDAIGMAGDLTIFGKRENILLIREQAGKKEFVRLNLNDSKLFSSPYFYMQQGDVLYVEPNKNKIASTDVAQVKRISIITGILTLLVVIVSRVKF